ncbi:MAG TPA: alpha/beta hydrolase [Kofleriaceae bacterium]
MSSPVAIVGAGAGPRVVFVHGSAADHTTWAIQLASPKLRARFELLAYDRQPHASVDEAAAELAGVIGDAPALVVGSSFGAVVGLALACTGRAPLAGLVLIEPPMAATDAPPSLMTGDQLESAADFLTEFDQVAAASGGPAAGELFLRRVLGEPAFARIPRAFLERSTAKWAAIRADCAALIAYPPRYASLAALPTPTLLLGGEQSAPYFRRTLDALAATLPHAQRATLPRAGHMLHAEAPYKFADILISFADGLGDR